MELIRESYFDKSSKKSWVENSESGAKPGVIFDRDGVEILIVLEYLQDFPKLMKFHFHECTKDDADRWNMSLQLSLYTNYWVNTLTGETVGYSEAFDDEGNLNENIITEFEFYVNLFGKSTNSTYSIYQMINSFIQSKLSDGLENYEPPA